jgi:hypothetical protein
MVTKKKVCSICLESVKKYADLNLNCECKYYVHYSCYYKWWKVNKSCIICHETAFKPNRPKLSNKTLRNRNKKKYWKRKINNSNIQRYDNERISETNEITFIVKLYTMFIFKILMYCFMYLFIVYIFKKIF